VAEIKPFKAISYNHKLLDSREQVIAPPYDVLNADEQLSLYQLSQYNIIRLEYGKTNPGDNADDNRYSRAAQTLSTWLTEGILEVEEQEIFYLYEQSFQYDDLQYWRRGIVASLKLEPYSSNIVLPHEQTFSAPKADRLELLKKTRTNISPIFTLYPDPEAYLSTLLNEISEAEPLFELEDRSGQKHRIIRIDNPDLQKEIIHLMKPQALLIADGHHRYETALNYRQLEGKATDPAADYILTVMVSMKEPGLLLLPTHRLFGKLIANTAEILVKLCERNFTLTLMDQNNGANEHNFWTEWKDITRAENTFAIITPDFTALLRPKAETGTAKLGVELLHELIIDPFLKMPGVTAEIKESLTFPHDFETTRSAVLNKNRDQIAFILDPIPVDQVYNLALQGKVMPQKTTYFYPKMPSGLLLRNLDLD
jgi:uncharacterized protein (DUF1015 family)